MTRNCSRNWRIVGKNEIVEERGDYGRVGLEERRGIVGKRVWVGENRMKLWERKTDCRRKE